MTEVSALAARVRAALKLISPDHITPMGVRMIEKVLDAADPVEHGVGNVYQIQQPGGKNGMWRGECICGQYVSGPNMRKEWAVMQVEAHAAGKRLNDEPTR